MHCHMLNAPCTFKLADMFFSDKLRTVVSEFCAWSQVTYQSVFFEFTAEFHRKEAKLRNKNAPFRNDL